ncbi:MULTISPECIES: LIMLP_04285 family protein [Leptospira]|uniref:Uncharacterized protein n=4 Tax=Leptospira borgpetersenii TaxID=174 RepID=M3H0G5_LEPBO|nr:MULTISPECIES: hypothetical protein [Leptospira]EMG00569.1 hypothetical protein LEP1GSC123_2778 [Leptospira borgpetersenii str. 200701203]ALO27300.1 hypothetical protein LBBP_03095 [Leptospira borgpetersenii serovar Ballum]ANH01672.2 Uncharacterized protein LB4E_2431 [Leptospira borgpetersenii str. 4E]AXX15182.1 hypothetical protein C4Q31_06105 [Leptospira borgpetersenii serovar Ceylonica]EKP14476.1 hypothetical protein LEP1GSC128_1448 [Leptospira borgpetersenii str. 200801926]
MITRLSIFLILFVSLFLNSLFADTVKNMKTNEVIENVKTSENEQGILVEYEDGMKRGFKKETITIEKKEITWAKNEESKEETKVDRYFALSSMSLLLILFFVLP